MATPTIVVTHGRDQRWQIGPTMQRDWADALRFGLQRVKAPYADDIEVRFAFYGDLWRVDVETERSDDLAPIQDEFAKDLLAVAGDAAARDAAQERSFFSTLTQLVAFVDEHVGIGGEVVLQLFLQDLAEYFRDDKRRKQANQVVANEVKAAKGDVVLIGHSMGTIVTYLSQFEEEQALSRVRGYLTFGSPLGMDSMRKHVQAIVPGLPFPHQPRRWVNVYNDEDFATMVRRLAPIFTSDDGRVVEDVPAKGQPPSPLAAGRGHDPLIYLSSLGLATQLRSLIDDLIPKSASRGAPKPPRAGVGDRAARDIDLGGERMAPPWLDEEPGDRGERGGGVTRAADVDVIDTPKTPRRTRGAAGDTQPKVVNRTLSADFPPVVSPGSEKDLLIAIAAQAVYGRGETGIAIERRDERYADLKIGVYAPDFEVTLPTGEPTAVTKVTLDLDDATQRLDARFRLKASVVKVAKPCSIWITVSRGILPIGQMELSTTIDPAYAGPKGEIRLSFTSAPDPDVVLIVSDRSDQTVGAGPFDLRVSREAQFVDRPVGAMKVTGNAWQQARDILEQFREVSKEPNRKLRVSGVTGIGVSLWKSLPEEFRDFYWEELHKSKATSIAVYSQEPYIPWELVVPQKRPGGPTEMMLGVRFAMARWKAGRHFPDPLVVNRMSVIAPTYLVGALPEAAKEAQDLIVDYGAKNVAGDKASVIKLLRSKGTQLIHFAGHGAYDPDQIDDSVIRLSDGSLAPRDLNTASIAQSDRPFVFLNACQVGEEGWDLTQIGGWADAFCDVGFSGFVGPYWKVNDLVARKAALVFYAALRTGQTVGEAMQGVRQRFYVDADYPAHPSWLAYSLHCQPNVHVKLPA